MEKGERDRKVGGEGRWRSGRGKETGRKKIWQRRILEEKKDNGGESQRDNGDKRELEEKMRKRRKMDGDRGKKKERKNDRAERQRQKERKGR